MTLPVYMSGSLVREIAEFVNSSGVATNPSSVTLKYKAGAGSVIVISGPENDSAGVFHWDIDTTGWTGPGNLLYTCEWIGTGAVQAIGSDYWEVSPAAI
jgi:hypothetical protein